MGLIGVLRSGLKADAVAEQFASTTIHRMLQPNQEKLDCFVRVITPENVEFDYALAGPFQRLPAFLFDMFIRLVAMFVLVLALIFTMPFVPLGGMFATVALILTFFVLSWFYGVYFETRFNGRTLGKMLFRLRAISVDGRPINGIQAALRNLLRFADLYPSPLAGLITMVLTSGSQRLGDLAANTMVVVDRGRHSPWDIKPDDVRAFGLAELIPATFVASHSLAQAIGMYMENRRRLPVPRRLDVAKHLAAPLLRKFELLPDTSPDLLLCALYVRIYMSEEQQQRGIAQLRAKSAATGSQAMTNRRAPLQVPPIQASASQTPPVPADKVPADIAPADIVDPLSLQAYLTEPPATGSDALSNAATRELGVPPAPPTAPPPRSGESN